MDIPHHKGLKGHSDADVLCHAIADAVLGAMGLPDIGFYFPPSDASIEGISSLKILEKCAALAAERGVRIENVDSSLIAEAPRVMKHAPRMKENIGAALGITPDRRRPGDREREVPGLSLCKGEERAWGAGRTLIKNRASDGFSRTRQFSLPPPRSAFTQRDRCFCTRTVWIDARVCRRRPGLDVDHGA